MGIEFGTVGALARTATRGVAHARLADLSPATTDALARELATVAARYRPRFGTMSTHDVARGRALVQDALDGMQLVPVTNRWHRPGVPAVTHADAFMGTVHTLQPRHVGDRVMRAVRRAWEQARSTHGPGELAGHTVFASAQFVRRDAIARHGGDAVAALRELAAARGSHGVARFGDRAHVLDPDVLERATVTARDSGMGLFPARPATLDRLDDVVLERLARSHGFRHDPFTAANDYRIGVDGAASAARRRESLHAVLHELPDDEAVARIRSYLESDAMTDLDHIVEVQVRGVRGRDVLATLPERAAADVDPVGV